MYLYKTFSRRLAACYFIFVSLGTVACRPEVKETKGEFKYFDLKGFFKADSARLHLANPTVHKTVSHNGKTESKDLKITNWGHELGLFTSSDINKPSWLQSYRIIKKDSSTTYQALSPDLKTQQIIVNKVNHKVISILVFNHTKNVLYETSEKLSYFPDSAYSIDKTQHVILLGDNRYIIKGNLLGK